MKRAGLALVAIAAVLSLSACEPDPPTPVSPDLKYCVDAGGTYKYHANSGSSDCFMPKVKVSVEDHTS